MFFLFCLFYIHKYENKGARGECGRVLPCLVLLDIFFSKKIDLSESIEIAFYPCMS